MTPEQWDIVNRELWCIVRLADGTDAKVYYVDGFEFRNYVDVGWVGGGHGFRDPYLGKDEIVIERMKNPHDEVAFLNHEVQEANLMCKGMGYDEAHDRANDSEASYRREVWQVPSPHKQD